MQSIKSSVDIFISFEIFGKDTDLQEEATSVSVENKAKAGTVTVDDVMELGVRE